MDNPATPDADSDVPLFPPAGTTRGADGELIGPDGEEILDPGDHEPTADQDPHPQLVMNPDAGQPLDDVEDGEDIGEADLDGPDEDDDEDGPLLDAGGNPIVLADE